MQFMISEEDTKLTFQYGFRFASVTSITKRKRKTTALYVSPEFAMLSICVTVLAFVYEWDYLILKRQ